MKIFNSDTNTYRTIICCLPGVSAKPKVDKTDTIHVVSNIQYQCCIVLGQNVKAWITDKKVTVFNCFIFYFSRNSFIVNFYFKNASQRIVQITLWWSGQQGVLQLIQCIMTFRSRFLGQISKRRLTLGCGCAGVY